MIRAGIIKIKMKRCPVEGMQCQGGGSNNSWEEGTSKMSLCDCKYSSVCALLAVLVVLLSLGAVPEDSRY